jgi:hypothetical protein
MTPPVAAALCPGCGEHDVDQALGGVGAPVRTGTLGHRCALLRVRQQRCHGCPQPLGGHATHQRDPAPLVRQVLSVVDLVVSGRRGEGDEHGGLAERGQLGGRPGTAAGDHHIGQGEYVGEIGADVSGEVEARRSLCGTLRRVLAQALDVVRAPWASPVT